MSTSLKALQSIVKRYRRASIIPVGGVVLIYQGSAYGWKNRLPDPQSEMPGAFAVDDFGAVWRADGGDDYHGAEVWTPLNPQSAQQGHSESLAAPVCTPPTNESVAAVVAHSAADGVGECACVCRTCGFVRVPSAVGRAV